MVSEDPGVAILKADAFDARRPAEPVDTYSAAFGRCTPARSCPVQGYALGAVAVMPLSLRRSASGATLLCKHSAALLQLGKYDEALMAATKATALRPRWAEAHLQKGAALAATGSLPEACSALR